MVIFIIVLVIIVLLLGYFIVTYNGLVSLRNKVEDSWSQIDVVLKNRNDLIPNLVETVKGYTKHEKETLNAVITARNKATKANNPEDEMKAAEEVTQALGRLFAIAESYPDLKANQNFLDLQNQLTETENKIAYARQFYNDTVLMYNNQCEMFPSNIIASLFKFNQADFFEADESAAEAPKVKF